MADNRGVSSKSLNGLRRISGDQYRYIFENMYEAAFLVDVETGIIVDTNLLATRLLGRKREEIVGRHYLQDHPSSTSRRTRWTFDKHVQMGTHARDVNFDGDLLKKDGTLVPVNYSACNLTIDGRRLVLGLFHDITERKQAEEALRETEKRYRDLFRNALSSIFVTGLRGKIIETNRAARNLTGYTQKELAHLNFSALFAPDDYEAFKETRRLLLRYKAQPKHCEMELIRKDGVKIPGELIARALQEAEKPVGFQILIRDIGVQKQAKENMQFYISQIIKAQEEERRRIACELHDETAQSLTALALDIQTVKRQINELSVDNILLSLERFRTKANSIQDGVRKLCQQLRIDVLEHLGLISALELLVNELENENIRGHIEVIGSEYRLKNEVELALYRIAQEALNNIRKHSRATEAAIYLEFRKNSITIGISDNGIGFKLPERLTDLVGKGKLGLVGIQERARSIHGNLSLASAENGTKLKIQVNV
jgi:PAS domain S-box-containing protein